jgi:UDP-glucose 6-dehydrogenase
MNAAIIGTGYVGLLTGTWALGFQYACSGLAPDYAWVA